MRTTLLALLCPLAATAQPVIQFANVNLIGNTYAIHLVTDPGTSDPNADGANVTWDFSSATLQMNAGSTSFIDPSSTPYLAEYPTCNLAQAITTPSGTTHTLFNLGPTQLDMLVERLEASDAFIYSDPKTPLVFPFAYEDFFIDDYTENGTDYSVSRAYMGYGTVILPTGTYTDVVKMASTSGSIDFFRSNPVSQLVNITDDGEILVFGDAQVGIGEGAPAVSLTAWPVPATDNVRIAGLAHAGHWQLLDAQGRLHQQGNHQPGTLVLDLAALATGQYMLVVQDRNSTQHVRLARQ